MKDSERESLKNDYVRELRAMVWQREQLEASEFLRNVQRGEIVRLAKKTHRYKIVLFRLIVRIMRILDEAENRQARKRLSGED